MAGYKVGIQKQNNIIKCQISRSKSNEKYTRTLKKIQSIVGRDFKLNKGWVILSSWM